jgi:hypothetical protein
MRGLSEPSCLRKKPKVQRPRARDARDARGRSVSVVQDCRRLARRSTPVRWHEIVADLARNTQIMPGAANGGVVLLSSAVTQ